MRFARHIVVSLCAVALHPELPQMVIEVLPR
jgi:hypothetical protein